MLPKFVPVNSMQKPKPKFVGTELTSRSHMKECLTNGGNKLTGNHPTSDTMLHMEVRLPVLLCAVKTVEGDFRFRWTTTPNVAQTHKENPNLVRILYMVCTLNDIYKQYNKLHEH